MNVWRTQWGVGRAGNGENTHTYTHSVPRDTHVDGASTKDRTHS